MRSIVWLASYPKSGNTWLRLLLANLTGGDARGINDLGRLGGIASGRQRFDETCLIAASLLTHDECDAMRPALYRHFAQAAGGQLDCRASELDPLDQWHWIKTHDGWTHTSHGEPLLGGAAVARAAVLIVRDPRDVVASLANHRGETLDQAAAMMADPASTFSGQYDRQPLQLRQQLLGWSGFNRSWLDQRDVPVHLLRYEDLQADTPGALGALLGQLGVAVDRAALERAMERCAFERLQAQEAAEGFREAPGRMTSGRFFRSGRSGGWREDLDEALRLAIEADHGAMMRHLGYLPQDGA